MQEEKLPKKLDNIVDAREMFSKQSSKAPDNLEVPDDFLVFPDNIPNNITDATDEFSDAGKNKQDGTEKDGEWRGGDDPDPDPD